MQPLELREYAQAAHFILVPKQSNCIWGQGKTLQFAYTGCHKADVFRFLFYASLSWGNSICKAMARTEATFPPKHDRHYDELCI